MFERGRVLPIAVIAVLLSTVVPVVGWVATSPGLERPSHRLPTAAHPVGPHAFRGLGKGRKRRCVNTNAARPVMLLFHGGGWILFSGAPMASEEEAARMQGFETINVDYVLGDVPTAFTQAVQLAKQLKKRGRRVYAYGESAGGTMAAFLAQRGLADSAAVHSPVSSIPDFINQTRTASASLSRNFFRSAAQAHAGSTEEVFSPAFRRKRASGRSSLSRHRAMHCLRAPWSGQIEIQT